MRPEGVEGPEDENHLWNSYDSNRSAGGSRRASGRSGGEETKKELFFHVPKVGGEEGEKYGSRREFRGVELKLPPSERKGIDQPREKKR